ncbi:MAG: carbamoyltransferase N-terminal domain-containing protein, partial [Patescibacteria group bacterium]
VDDAAGEAFDKVAKLLHLGYPGGPIVSQRAVDGDAAAFKFPRPMIESPNFNFSFSGLKTAVLYQSQKINLKNKQNVNDICASFQQAVVDVLVGKTIKAAKKYKVKTVLLAGGVAANKELREKLRQESEKLEFNFLVPEFKLCTDNAAMIAIAAYYLSQKKMPKLNGWEKIKVDPNWEL